MVAIVFTGALAACSSPDPARVALAAPAPLKVTGFATDVPQAAEFVRQTRGASTDFIPVGVTPPARETQPRKGDDVARLQQDLETTRRRHDSLAGRQPDAASALGDQLRAKKLEPRN